MLLDVIHSIASQTNFPEHSEKVKSVSGPSSATHGLAAPPMPQLRPPPSSTCHLKHTRAHGDHEGLSDPTSLESRRSHRWNLVIKFQEERGSKGSGREGDSSKFWHDCSTCCFVPTPKNHTDPPFFAPPQSGPAAWALPRVGPSTSKKEEERAGKRRKGRRRRRVFKLHSPPIHPTVRQVGQNSNIKHVSVSGELKGGKLKTIGEDGTNKSGTKKQEKQK